KFVFIGVELEAEILEGEAAAVIQPALVLGIDPVAVDQAIHNVIFHVYTSCVTFDKSFKTWTNLKKWVHPLPEGYNPTDYRGAVNQVLDDDFSVGVIFRREASDES
ncbi:MAG: hypothetical protein PHS86_10870, partial [Syntrophaceae bacterium]|nr:hypothetical protein [Syntrophaceae bacterium]